MEQNGGKEEKREREAHVTLIGQLLSTTFVDRTLVSEYTMQSHVKITDEIPVCK